MPKLTPFEYERRGPYVQLIPLIDILFFILILFMTLYIFNQQEAETSISVPQARGTKVAIKSPGQIIINITKDGRFIVSQQEMDVAQLENMLKKVVELFPNQSIVIRADQDTYHKFVIEALDACARAGIWDISFSAAAGD